MRRRPIQPQKQQCITDRDRVPFLTREKFREGTFLPPPPSSTSFYRCSFWCQQINRCISQPCPIFGLVMSGQIKNGFQEHQNYSQGYSRVSEIHLAQTRWHAGRIKELKSKVKRLAQSGFYYRIISCVYSRNINFTCVNEIKEIHERSWSCVNVKVKRGSMTFKSRSTTYGSFVLPTNLRGHPRAYSANIQVQVSHCVG